MPDRILYLHVVALNTPNTYLFVFLVAARTVNPVESDVPIVVGHSGVADRSEKVSDYRRDLKIEIIIRYPTRQTCTMEKVSVLNWCTYRGVYTGCGVQGKSATRFRRLQRNVHICVYRCPRRTASIDL